MRFGTLPAFFICSTLSSFVVLFLCNFYSLASFCLYLPLPRPSIVISFLCFPLLSSAFLCLPLPSPPCTSLHLCLPLCPLFLPLSSFLSLSALSSCSSTCSLLAPSLCPLGVGYRMTRLSLLAMVFLISLYFAKRCTNSTCSSSLCPSFPNSERSSLIMPSTTFER